MFLPSNITLKFGDNGDFVAELQRRLAMVHCFDESQVNGFFDGTTVNGVTRFQGMNGLHADGVAGPETLRRLNGVIAGDSSGSGDKKEEEAKLEQSTSQINQWMIDQTPADPTLLSPAHAPQETSTLHVPDTHELVQHVPAPVPQPIAAPAMQPQDLHLMGQPQQHAPQPPANDLASMLMAQMQQPQPQMQAAPPPPQEHTRPPMQEQPPVQQFQPVPPMQPVQQEPMVPQQPAPQQGLIGKTMQFANAMMQKIADYFEAKLPPSVLNEVKNIGVQMAQHGIKEAPIPGGPEMGGPSQAPARGPEQQPQIQRGG